ncbi:MAG: pyridoxamine 5'-phosphate oxidase family protein [Candidatus Ozemobacteraceae bacterium]
MTDISEIMRRAWDQREGPVVLSTVDPSGVPNAIYANCVKLLADGAIAVVDNYFKKTLDNIKSGSKGSVLFITKEKKAFQTKGTIEYFTDGPIFDDMRKWADQKYPRHGVAVLRVEKLYSGADELT